MDNSVAVNDIIATKDGQKLRVLSVRYSGNDIQRVEGIDDSSPCPMRTNVFKENFLRVLVKSPWVLYKKGIKVDVKTGKPWGEKLAEGEGK